MKFLKNKTNAMLICFIIVIIGLFAGSLRCINLEKSRARKYFSSAVKLNAVPLVKDLKTKCGHIENLITLYKKYSSDTKATALERSLKDLKAALNSPQKAYKFNVEVSGNALIIENAIDALTLSSNDRDAFTRLKQELKSIDDIISRSNYNSVAEEANAKINSLPIGFFKSLMFIRNVEYFK